MDPRALRGPGVSCSSFPVERRTLLTIEAAVLLVAIGVRVAGLQAYEQTLFADHPMVDAYTYWEQAEGISRLVQDNGASLLRYWTRPSSLDGRDPFAEGFYQPPGYPVFLYLLGKLGSGPDLALTRAVQAAMGVATTGLLVLLGRRAGSPLGAPWAGAVAGLLFSLYPTTLLFEQDILTPALTGFLFTASLWLLWDERPRSDEAPAGPLPARTALAGLLQGLAVVVHPTYLLASGVSAAWLFRQGWLAPPRIPAGRRLASTLALLLGLGLALSPTAWRNAAIHHQPALVSHNSGVNFYLGNNPGWRDTMFLRPGLPFRKLVLEAEPHERQVHERNDYWWERTQAEIREKPIVWGATVMTKALWSFNDLELPRNEDYRCRTDDGPLAWVGRLPVHYGWVLPLALLGAVGLVRRGGPGGLVPGAWLALHLPLVVFIVSDRYRLATWPLVCIAAAVGVVAVVDQLRRRALPHWSWALLLVPLAVAHAPLDRRTDYDEAWCLHVDGNLALMAGDNARAAELYRQALELDPEDWGARDFLARTLYEEGKVDAAAELMEPLVEWFPDHYPTLYFMGRLEEKRGRTNAAADYLGRAYRVPGDRTSTGVRYVRMLVEAGRVDEARAVVAADETLRGHPKLAGVLPDDR